ncbi:efflux RND transporter periplasmic adaptor subunit [Methylopila musalis]|uniref:Efflux RND transporter periplasmic adaptor subunit n=1 Tax=Methylopila musalis TaxID=1134781 RepID=A0ABW3Z3I4_9HYPH
MAKARKSGRRWAVVVLALALAGGGWLFWTRASDAPVATVMTSPVSRADIDETVLASGVVKPVELVAVGAQASGRLVTLHATVGQAMKRGDLIAEIDSLTQQNALKTAQASVANVKAQKTEREATLAYAESALKRQENTLALRASSRDEYESALSTVRTTRAQIEALDAQIAEAEVAVATAEVNLGYARVTAPIDGVVLAVVTQQGQTVNAAQSAPTIVILGRTDVMRVRAEISEVDVTRVRAGQSVYFTVLGDPDRRYEARLAFIEPAPESITSDSSFSSSSSVSSSSSASSSSEAIYYNGVFDVPNPEGRLLTYMTAQVRIVIREARGVLAAPTAALTDRSAGDVYAVRVQTASGALERRRVRVGARDEANAEVLEGLTEGERVVTGEASATSTSGRRPGPPPMM